MHKWRLLLFLVLSLLQPILSEHIVIDGRSCSSHSSFNNDERFNGKYPFDKPDTLRLRTVRENCQDGHRNGGRQGEHDVRFSGGNHLEDRIFSTYDRSRNFYERRLYRTERDERKSFDRDFFHKQRLVIENNANRRDTSPYARISYENQEREIQQRNKNWTVNLNVLDRTVDRTSRNFGIRQIVKKTKSNENNGDMLRQKVRQRDFTTESDRDEATDRRGLMTERWERDISIKHQEMSKLFDTNIARAQYRSKAKRENGDNRNNVRDINSVPSEGKTYQRNMEQSKDEHITSSLDLSLNSFERHINQRKSRNTPGRRTNVRDGERQSDGEKITKRVTRSRTEKYDDMRRSLYGYARSNPERFIAIENKLQRDSRRNTHEDVALKRVEPKISGRDDRTNIKNEYDIPTRRNLRLQDVARDTVGEVIARNQQTRNMYDRMYTRKQESRVRDNFERSGAIERDLRQQISTTMSEYAAQRQDQTNANVRDDRTGIWKQERYTRNNSERVISTELPEQQTTRQRAKSENTAYTCEERNTNIKDDRKDISKQERYARDYYNRAISVQRDQLQQNTKRLMSKYTASRRKESNAYVRDSRTDNRIQERHEKANILNRLTFAGRDRKNSIRDMDNYNYITYDRREQNTNAQDTREHRIYERYPTNIRIIDRYAIDDFGQKPNSDEYQIRYSDVRERQNSNNHQDSKMYEKNKGTTITDTDWNVKDSTRINSDRRQTSMYTYFSQSARITDKQTTEQTSTHNIRKKSITDQDLVVRNRQQRNMYVRDIRLTNKNDISLSRYNNYDRSMSLERNVHLEEIRRVMDGQMGRSQKIVNTRVLDERQDDFRNYERHSKDNNRIRINVSQGATSQHSRRISGAHETRKGNEHKTNKRHVFIIADSNEQRHLIDNIFRSQHEWSQRKNTDVRNTQNLENAEKRVNRIDEKRSTDARNQKSHVEHSKETIMKRSFSGDRGLRQPDVNRITDRQIICTREELNTLLDRDSRYLRERAVFSRVRESDVRRIMNGVERIILKDELDEIQYNTRSFRNNGREKGAFTEYGTRYRNDKIKNKPFGLIREERIVSSERIDITNKERNLMETNNERTGSSRQERQRRDVRIESEREQTLRDNKRRSRYNTREKAMIVELKVSNLDSRTGAVDTFKYRQNLQKAYITKEPSRVSKNAVSLSFSTHERTALMEKKSYLRNERTHNTATNRNTNVWNTERFVRDNAQEGVIARGMRKQKAIIFTRTESRNPSLRRTDERNYLTEGKLFTRNYERSLDLYQEIERKIGNSNGNLNRIYVKHDHSRRHAESANKRIVFGTIKAPENLSTTLFYGQYLFYAIQSIYVFSVFMQIFRQKDAKTGSMTWLAATPHIKVD